MDFGMRAGMHIRMGLGSWIGFWVDSGLYLGWAVANLELGFEDMFWRLLGGLAGCNNYDPSPKHVSAQS